MRRQLTCSVVNKNRGIGTYSDRNLCDLEFVDVVVLLSGYPSKFQVFLARLNNSAVISGMGFRTLKCKML